MILASEGIKDSLFLEKFYFMCGIECFDYNKRLAFLNAVSSRLDSYQGFIQVVKKYPNSKSYDEQGVYDKQLLHYGHQSSWKGSAHSLRHVHLNG